MCPNKRTGHPCLGSLDFSHSHSDLPVTGGPELLVLFLSLVYFLFLFLHPLSWLMAASDRDRRYFGALLMQVQLPDRPTDKQLCLSLDLTFFCLLLLLVRRHLNLISHCSDFAARYFSFSPTLIRFLSKQKRLAFVGHFISYLHSTLMSRQSKVTHTQIYIYTQLTDLLTASTAGGKYIHETVTVLSPSSLITSEGVKEKE